MDRMADEEECGVLCSPLEAWACPLEKSESAEFLPTLAYSGTGMFVCVYVRVIHHGLIT